MSKWICELEGKSLTTAITLKVLFPSITTVSAIRLLSPKYFSLKYLREPHMRLLNFCKPVQQKQAVIRMTAAAIPSNHMLRSKSHMRRPLKKRRKRELTEEKRKQRNAKEQARSNQLSQQFDDLRNLLTQAGIVVPKGTKGCVLTASFEYIKVLQASNQHKEM